MLYTFVYYIHSYTVCSGEWWHTVCVNIPILYTFVYCIQYLNFVMSSCHSTLSCRIRRILYTFVYCMQWRIVTHGVCQHSHTVYIRILYTACQHSHAVYVRMPYTFVNSLLQNKVSFIGFFCKRDLSFNRGEWWHTLWVTSFSLHEWIHSYTAYTRMGWLRLVGSIES